LVRAEASARRAVQLDPTWADAQFVLGNVLAAAHKNGALEAYGEAVRLAPRSPHFQYQLGLALDKHGEFAAAARAFEARLQIAPEFWPALSQLAFLLRRMCEWHSLP